MKQLDDIILWFFGIDVDDFLINFDIEAKLCSFSKFWFHLNFATKSIDYLLWNH
jgi:hypothetical protein